MSQCNPGVKGFYTLIARKGTSILFTVTIRTSETLREKIHYTKKENINDESTYHIFLNFVKFKKIWIHHVLHFFRGLERETHFACKISHAMRKTE